MCGISGEVHCDQEYPISRWRAIEMRDKLISRGPDDAGYYEAPGIALGTRRLAILDLSVRGHMPMSTPDGRFWITYNGEVYNHRELRESLEARGHQFASHSDTEVLLTLYATYGPNMLEHLNGMFAFAVWDGHERTLFLARDRVGVKPLYYTAQSGDLYFASEAKALFRRTLPPAFDSETLEELLCFRYVAGEQTPFRNVKRLLPGHSLLWKDGDIRIRRWWQLGERVKSLRENPPPDPEQWFQETFDDAVRSRLVSDVPVGVLLSGGLDSSSIASSMAPIRSLPTASFTVRFEEREYDEGLLAREVAGRFNLDHRELFVLPEQLLTGLIEASQLNDEPLGHGNDFHLLAISRFAKPHVSVLLSGEGSDETLGGYVRYQPLRFPRLLRAARRLHPGFILRSSRNSRLRKFDRFLGLGTTKCFVLFNACDVLPKDLAVLGMPTTNHFPFREQILDEASALYPREPVRQAMYSDQHTFLCSILDRNDRMTMGASIECRVPFLDYRLVEGLAGLQSQSLFLNSGGKHLLRASVGRRLPNAVQNHRKWGFGVPWTKYLRERAELRELIHDIHKAPIIKDGPFRPERVAAIAASFLNGDRTYEALVRQLFFLSVWHQSYFTNAYPIESMLSAT